MSISYSSSLEINKSNNELILFDRRSLRCPLCNSKARMFYCQECVKHGDFYHSNIKVPDRYADKKLEYICLQSKLQHLQNEIHGQHMNTTSHYLLKQQIQATKDRNKLLKKVIMEKKTNTLKLKKQELELTLKNTQLADELPKFKLKLAKLTDRLERLKENCDQIGCQLSSKKDDLTTIVQKSINELQEYIFIIQKIEPTKSEANSTCEATVQALAEASGTTYVQGRWVYNDTLLHTTYMIISPVLPANADYSTFTKWCSNDSNNCTPPSTDIENRSASLNVTAGLMYLHQLVMSTAFYLDINLPKKLSLKDFWGEHSDEQFHKKIVRLNYNILYLCLSQNVSLKELHPFHIVRNIVKLFDKDICDLGRTGHFEFPDELESLDNQCWNLAVKTYDDEEDGDEDDDTISSDWDAVPDVGSLDLSYAIPSSPSQGRTTPLPSSLSSVVSFVKGFTGQK